MIGPHVLLAPSRLRLVALALGTLLITLGLAALLWPRHHRYAAHLEARSWPCAIYFSAWDDGPVVLEQDGSGGDLHFHRRFVWSDRCTWESTEQLTPVDKSRFLYRYSERVVSCPPGLSPRGLATPRNGIVTLEEISRDARPTPHDGVHGSTFVDGPFIEEVEVEEDVLVEEGEPAPAAL